MTRELMGLYRHFRRYYYWWFHKRHVLENIKIRKGTCLGCGCCRTRIIKCKWFNKETNKCFLWDEFGRIYMPLFCVLAPFDEKDKTKFQKEHCGYYWENENEKNKRNS